MVIFYKKLKKYNEILLTKKQTGLNNRKNENHKPSPVLDQGTYSTGLGVLRCAANSFIHFLQ